MYRKYTKSIDIFHRGEFQISETHPNLANLAKSSTIDYGLCSGGLLAAITYASSAPYDLESLGDHRGFLIDVDITSLLGKDGRQCEAKGRKLETKNTKALDKYLTKVEKNFKK